MDSYTLDTILMWMVAALITVVVLLGAFGAVDMDEQKLLYPESVPTPSVQPTVYAPAP